jgi:hypothetical protein
MRQTLQNSKVKLAYLRVLKSHRTVKIKLNRYALDFLKKDQNHQKSGKFYLVFNKDM